MSRDTSHSNINWHCTQIGPFCLSAKYEGMKIPEKYLAVCWSGEFSPKNTTTSPLFCSRYLIIDHATSPGSPGWSRLGPSDTASSPLWKQNGGESKYVTISETKEMIYCPK